MAVTEYSDYRTYLLEEFARRQTGRESYSLRMFARDLGLSASSLSHVFNRKKGMSVNMAHSIAMELDMKPSEAKYFCDLVAAEHGRSERSRQAAQARLDEHGPQRGRAELRMHQFRSIADWHHHGIVELTRTKDFQNNPKWIAARLGITPLQAAAAVNRLLNLGVLEEVEGQLVKPQQHTATKNDVQDRALRQLHQDMLEKAKQAIDEQPIETREVSTVFMTIDKKRLPELKSRLRELRKQFACEAEGGESEQLYCLSSQFFRLDRKKEPNS